MRPLFRSRRPPSGEQFPHDYIPVGTVFNHRWEVERGARHGGNATVYPARDLRISGQRRAIKAFDSQGVATPALRRWFEREIKNMTAVTGPNVVQILDFGEDYGLMWIAMQWIDGVTLDDPSMRGLALRDIAAIVRGATNALAACRRAEMSHGDVAPRNLMVSGEPGNRHTTLLDFGVSRAWLTHRPGDPSRGTSNFEAPELAKTGLPTNASDQYSLACVVFFMVSGRPVFDSANRVVVQQSHEHGIRPRLQSVADGVPDELDNAVACALSKDPAARYATVEEFFNAAFAADADPGLERLPVPSTRPSPPRRRRWAARWRRLSARTRARAQALRESLPRIVPRALARPGLLLGGAVLMTLALDHPAADKAPSAVLRSSQATMITPPGWTPARIGRTDRRRGFSSAASGEELHVLLGSTSARSFTRDDEPMIPVTFPRANGVLIDQATAFAANRVYVFRTPTAYVTVACRWPAGAGARALPGCEQAAVRLQLRERTIRPLNPGLKTRRQVDAAVNTYIKSRRAAVQTLNTARRQATSRDAARKVAEAGDRAATRLTAPGFTRLRNAIRRAAAAWMQAAGAAKKGSKKRFNTAGGRVIAADGKVDDAVAELAALGFRRP